VRVLISGAHGLIGSALAADLSRDGHAVVTLKRPGSKESPSSIEASVLWDPAQSAIDRGAFARLGPFDAVVHLAGAGLGDHRWTARRRSEISESRIRSTRLLAAELSNLDPVPAVFVCASAVGIYGNRGDEVLTESSAPGSGFLADLCRQWEAECRPAADAGIRVVNLRSGIVLTSRGGALRRQIPLFLLGLGGRLGTGRQYWSWITLADEIRVIRRAIQDPRFDGPLNSTSPNPVTNAEFTRALGRALHRPVLFAAPRTALGVVLGREMADEMLLASQRVVPERLTLAGHRFGHPDLGGALEAVTGAQNGK
jgi:uncharacterized protein